MGQRICLYITVQIILSLNELMLNLTLKHRDAFFTRYVLGSKTADAILSTEKSEEMHATSLVGSAVQAECSLLIA
jgi:hypothetical protein